MGGTYTSCKNIGLCDWKTQMFKKSTLEPNILLNQIHQLLDINIKRPHFPSCHCGQGHSCSHEYTSIHVSACVDGENKILSKSWQRSVNVVHRCWMLCSFQFLSVVLIPARIGQSVYRLEYRMDDATLQNSHVACTSIRVVQQTIYIMLHVKLITLHPICIGEKVCINSCATTNSKIF